MSNPKCQYCGKEMNAKCHSFNMYDTKFCFECSCGARSPLKNTPEEAYMAAMKKEDGGCAVKRPKDCPIVPIEGENNE